MKTNLTLLFFIAFLIESVFLFGQAGVLNNDFGDNGVVTTPISQLDDRIYDIVILPNGKIIAAGYSSAADSTLNFSIAKYHADGFLDESFGNQGKVTLDFYGGDDFCNSILTQPDGKIILAGVASYDPTFVFALARFEVDGTLDNTFGDNGKVITDILGGSDTGTSVKLQADGKILVGGNNRFDGVNDQSIAIVRYNMDGSIDTTFGVDGIAENQIGIASYGIDLQSNGKIVSNGTILNDTVTNVEALDFAVFRFNTNGTVDSTFGINGIGDVHIGKFDFAEDLWVQPDDKILIVGNSSFEGPNGSFTSSSIIRFNANGQLDTTFNEDGVITFDLENTLTLGLAISQQDDGKIIVSGRTTNYNTGIPGKLFVVRMLEDGTFDSNFGDEGVVILDSGNEIGHEGKAIAFNSNNTITIGGEIRNNNKSDYFLAQFWSEINVGTLNFSKHNNEITIYPNPVMGDLTLSYNLTQKENISIDLYNINGALIKSLFSQQEKGKGKHQTKLYLDSTIQSGNYILSISNGSEQIGLKIIKHCKSF